jgi:hypothetical protein
LPSNTWIYDAIERASREDSRSSYLRKTYQGPNLGFNEAAWNNEIETQNRLLPTFSGEPRDPSLPMNRLSRAFLDLRNDQLGKRMVYDRYPFERALEDIQASDFVRGSFGWNIENQKWTADMIHGAGFGIWKEGSEFFEVPEEFRKMLQYYADTDKGNIWKILEGATGVDPLALGWQDDITNIASTSNIVHPMDLMGIRQEGFTVAAGLRELEELNPELYNHYIYAFGSVTQDEDGNMVPTPELLLRVGEGARNGHELLLKLNTSLQLAAIGRTLEAWERDTDRVNRYWAYAKNFVVQGILNDPDLLAEMIFSTGLGVVSGGLGAAAGGVVWATRINKLRNLMNKNKLVYNTVFGLGKGLSKLSRKTRVLGNWLIPENIPHSLVYTAGKRLPGRFGRWATHGGGWTKAGLWAGTNVLEGGISGGVAEAFNQSAKVNYGLSQEWDWDSIWTEAALEAVISPVLNPVMSLGFKTVIHGPPLLVGGTVNVLGGKRLTKAFGEQFRRTVRFLDPGNIDNTILLEQAMMENGLSLEDLTGGAVGELDFKNSPELSIILSTLGESFDGTDADLVNTIGSHLKDMVEGRKQEGPNAEKMTPQQLYMELANRLYEEIAEGDPNRLGSKTLKTIREVIEMRLSVLKSWQNEKKRAEADPNIKDPGDLNDFVDTLIKENKYFEHLPQGMRDKVKEQMGEAAYNEATNEQRMEHLKKIETDLAEAVNTRRRELGVTIDETQRQIKKIAEEVNPPDDDASKPVTSEDEAAVDTADADASDISEEGDAETGTDPKADEAEADEEDVELFPEDTHGVQKDDPVTQKQPEGNYSAFDAMKDVERSLNRLLRDLAEGNLNVDQKIAKRVQIAELKRLKWRLKEDLMALDALVNGDMDQEGVELAGELHDSASNLSSLISEYERIHREDLDEFYKHYSARNKESTMVGLARLKGRNVYDDPDTGEVKPKKHLDRDDLTEAEVEVLLAAADELKKGSAADKKKASQIYDFINRQAGAEKTARGRRAKKARLTNKALINIVKAFQERGTDLADKLNTSKEGRAKHEAVEEYEKLRTKFKNKRMNSRLNESMSKRREGEFMFTTATTWQTVIQDMRLKREQLETSKKHFDLEMEGKSEDDAISEEDMLYLLPKDSPERSMLLSQKRAREQADALNKKNRRERYNELREEGKTSEEAFAILTEEKGSLVMEEPDTFTVTEAKAIFDEEYATVKRKIKDFELDHQILVDAEQLAFGPEERIVTDVPLGTYIPADYSPEDLITGSAGNVGKVAEELLDPMKNSEAWTEYATQILGLATSTQVHRERDGTRSISAMRLYSVMPDLFHKQGRAPHMLFRDAVIHKGDGSEEWMISNAAHLRYNIDMVLDIAKGEQRRASTFVKGEAEKKELYMQEIQKRTSMENTTQDLADSIVFLEKLHLDVLAVNRSLFDTHGFIVNLDETTGHPESYRPDSDHARDLYETQYKHVSTIRFRDRWGKLSIVQKQRILKDLGFADYRALDENYLAEVDKRKGNEPALEDYHNRYEENFVLHVIQEELWRVSEDLTILGFGDGTIDWISADQAAEAVVDFVTRKDISSSPGRVMTDEHTGELGKEGTDYGEDSLETALAKEFELHGAAPRGPTHVAKALENFIHRRRLRAVIEVDFSKLTKAERQEMWEEVKRRAIEGGVNVGDERAPRVIPSPTYGTMGGKPMTREDMRDFMVEFLYDFPAFAHSFVQDQIIRPDGSHLRLSENLATFWDGLTVGDDTIVPYSEMTEMMALEMRDPEGWEGLSEAAIHRLFELEDAWAKENGRDQSIEGWRDGMFSTVNEADRNDSVAREIQIAAMLGHPDGQKLIKELREGVFEILFKNKPDDAHVWGGKQITKLMDNDLGHVIKNKKIRDRLKPLRKLLSIFDDIDHNNVAASLDKMDPETKNLYHAVRDFVKVPLLREKYEAGKKAFNNEFRKDSGKGKSELIKALRAYEAKHGEVLIDLDSQDGRDFIDALEVLLFATMKDMDKTIVSHAARMDPALKQKAIEYLSVPLDQEHHLQHWQKLVRDAEGDPEAFRETLKNPITHQKSLKARLRKIAVLKYGDASQKNYDKVVKLFRGRVEKALAFIEGLRMMGEKLEPGSENWGHYVEILTGEIMPWKDIPYFEAINSLNASAHKLDPNRWKAVSEGMGFTDFDMKDALGLENTELQILMYMTSLPSEKSARGYVIHNLLFGNTQGEKFGRVAVNPQKLMDFVERRYQEIREREGREPNNAEKVSILSEYYSKDKDNVAQSGVWDLVDDPYGHMKPEEFIDYVEGVILKQAVLQYCSVQAPPIKGYTEDTETINQELAHQWHSDSEARHESLKEEMAIELELLRRVEEDNDMGALRNLEERASLNRIYTHEVAAYMSRNITKYHVAEVSSERTDRRYLPNGRPVVNTTQSHSPKAKTALAPYSSRGSLRMQLEHLKRMETDLQSEIRELAGIGEPSGEDTGSMGWQSPWKRESLPKGVPLLTPDYSLEGVPAESALRASELHGEINTWAERAGYGEELRNNPELYPSFYITMEMEKERNRIYTLIRRKKKNGETINYTEMRNLWLKRIKRVTQISRDILKSEGRSLELEDKLQPLYILNEITDDMTFREILLGDLLSRDVLNKDAIAAGAMPSEGITIVEFERDSVTGEQVAVGNVGEGYQSPKDIALQVMSTIVQMNDFNGLLLKQLLDRYRVRAIRNVMKGHKNIESLVRDKNIMDTDAFTRAQKIAINQETMRLALETGGNDIIIDVTLEEAAMKQPALTMSRLENVDPHTQKGKIKAARGQNTDFRFNMRMPVSMFSTAVVGAPRRRKGANITIAISMESALHLFALNSNRKLMDRITAANMVGAPYGSKVDPNTGERIPNESMSQTIDNLVGYRVEEETRRDIHTSEALELLAGKKPDGTSRIKEKVKNRRRKVEHSKTEVVNLEHYSNNPASNDTGFQKSWLESHIHSLESRLIDIERRYIVGSEEVEIIKTIRGHVNDVRTQRDSQPEMELAVIAHSLVFEAKRRGEPTPTVEEVSVFIYRQDLGTDVDADKAILNAIVEAENSIRKLSILGDKKISDIDNGLVTASDRAFWKAREYAAYSQDRDNPGFDDFLDWSGRREQYDKMNSEAQKRTEKTFEAAIGAEIDSAEERSSSFIQLKDEELIGSRSDLLYHASTPEVFDIFIDEKVQRKVFAESLRNINTDVNDLIREGVVTDEEAKLLRGMFLRLYELNPMLLHDVRMRMSSDTRLAAKVQQDADNTYVIRVGKNVKTLYGHSINDKLSMVELIAHELGHIAQHKFIGENSIEFGRWQQLKRDGGGESLIEKLCIAFHGGVKTPKAEAEIRSYMENDKEFIAGMVSYFLLADALPDLPRLNPKEEQLLNETKTIVDKIINFVRNLLWDVRSVFVDFEAENKESSDQLNDLLMRTLGRDPESYEQITGVVGNDRMLREQTKYVPAGVGRRMVAGAVGGGIGAAVGGPVGAAVGAAVGAGAVGPRAHTIFEDSPHSSPEGLPPMSDEEFIGKVERLMDVEEERQGLEADERAGRPIDKERLRSLQREERDLQDFFATPGEPGEPMLEGTGGLYGAKKGIFGQNRYQYERNILKLKKLGIISRGIRNQDSVLHINDLIKVEYTPEGKMRPVLNNDLGSDETMGKALITSAFEFVIKQAYERQGVPMSEGVGAWALALSENLMTAWDISGKIVGKAPAPTNRVRNFVIQALTGLAGGGMTYGSPLFPSAILSSVLDEQSTTTLGHSVNIGGSTSIREAVDRTAIFMNPIHRGQEMLLDSILKYQEGGPMRVDGFGNVMKGRKIDKELRAQTFRELCKQVWLKVDNPQHKIEIPNGANKEMAEQAIEDLVRNIRNYIELIESGGKETGKIGEFGYISLVPHRMARHVPSDSDVNLRETLNKAIKEHLAEEMAIEDGSGGICPVHLTVTKGYMPRLTSRRNFLDDYDGMNDEFQTWYEGKMNSILEGTNTFTKRVQALRRKVAEGSKADSEEWAFLKAAHNEILEQFFRKKITWKAFESSTLRQKMRDDYSKTLGLKYEGGQYIAVDGEAGVDFTERLGQFTESRNTLPSGINTGTSLSAGRNHPVDILRSSYTNFAQDSLYINNNNWTVPPMSKILDSDAAEYFIIDPLTIMQEFHKGIGSDVTESQLLSEIFGVDGSYDNVIALGLAAVNNMEPGDRLRNLDGTVCEIGTREKLEESLLELQRKSRYMRGVTRKDKEPLAALNVVLEILPDAAKIAFGTNLTAAVLVVEGGLNVWDMVAHPTSVTSGLNAILTPITRLASPRARREIAIDMMHITDALISAHYADLDETVTIDPNKFKKFTKKWGIANVFFAQKVLTALAHTRASQARLAVSKMIISGKLDDLVELLNDEHPDIVSGKRKRNSTGEGIHRKLVADDSSLFFKLCREAGFGFGVGPFRLGNRELLRYLLRSGLLETSKYTKLKQMLGHDGKAPHLNLNTEGKKIYWINDMKKELETNYASNKEGFNLGPDEANIAQSQAYRDQLYILQGLRQVERLFIEDVLLTPNAMDMYTKPSAAGMAWEVYMRYPTVFAANKVLRQSGRVTPLRFLLNIGLASVLDMLYMMLLGMAFEDGWERTKTKLNKQNRLKTLSMYGLRLPVLGRFMGLLGEVSKVIFDQQHAGSQSRSIQPVGISGIIETLKAGEGGRSALAEGDWQGALDELHRHIPIIGDILLRIGYNLWRQQDEEEQRDPNQRFAPRDTYGMGTMDIDTYLQDMGMDENAAERLLDFEETYGDLSDEELFTMLLKEVGAYKKIQGAGRTDNNSIFNNFRTEAPQQAPQPTAPEPAVETPVETDVVDKIAQDPQGPSGKLADLLG